MAEISDRDRVMIQREAVRRYIREFRISPVSETSLREVFPLPPIREPNVVRVGDREFRADPQTGRIQCRCEGRWDWMHWEALAEIDAAIRQLALCPWVERPAEEE